MEKSHNAETSLHMQDSCSQWQGRSMWMSLDNNKVCRLVDESGQPIGPFRVWLQYAWIPGLAMSRALGDALAHQ